MTTPIEALIAQFTDDLTQLVRRNALQQVLSALGGEDVPRSSGRPRMPRRTSAKPGRVGARARGTRSAQDVAAMREQLLAHVKAHPGQRGEQIAAALKTDVKTMRAPMLELIAEKKVRTEGQRRGMTYFATGGGGGGAARKARATKKKRARVTRKKSGARPTRKASSKPARKPRRKSGRKPARKARAKAIPPRPQAKPANAAPAPAPVVETATDAQKIPPRAMNATA